MKVSQGIMPTVAVLLLLCLFFVQTHKLREVEKELKESIKAVVVESREVEKGETPGQTLVEYNNRYVIVTVLKPISHEDGSLHHEPFTQGASPFLNPLKAMSLSESAPEFLDLKPGDIAGFEKKVFGGVTFYIPSNSPTTQFE